MKFIRIVLVIAALALAGTAQAGDYGGVSGANEQQMTRLVYAHFGTGWKGQTMIRCVRRESGFNPRAVNWDDPHGGSFGLFQINGIHAPGGYATRSWIAKMMNPYENVKVAVRLARGGLGPWGGGC